MGESVTSHENSANFFQMLTFCKMKENSQDRQEISSWEQLDLNRACQEVKCRVNLIWAVVAQLDLLAANSMEVLEVKILQDLDIIKKINIMHHTTHIQKLKAIQV